jgi:uncharacterized protein (DUF1800 family)
MRRFQLMGLLALLAACSSGGGKGVPVQPMPVMPVPEPREQTADQQVTHALNRLAFGARPGDAARVRALGVDAWIEQQLRPESISDVAFEQFLGTNYPTIYESPAMLEQRFTPPGQIQNQAAARGGMTRADSVRLRESQQGIRQMTAEVQSSRVARAIASERQLQEVVTDFWLNHFSVYDAKGPRQRYMLGEYENRVIRPNAFGKFRTLLGAVAKSDAMLFYLDNWQSQADNDRPRLAPPPGGRGGRAGAPAPARRGGLNENYGRELLELHTLGVDGGYTQQDVIAAARALTGWTLRGFQQGGGFQFVPFMHDAGQKKFLGRTLQAGRGLDEGEEVLDIVAKHPSTARYIAFKLARRFVSDTPSKAIVDRAAATFTRTDGDIRETVRSIITSAEFFSRAAYRSKVKSPFEVVTSAARALGAAPDPTPRMAQAVGQLGQPIYGHQAPNGWPETGDQWMNTGAILNRINFGMQIAAGRLPGASPLGFRDADMLQTATRELQVDGVVAALLGGDVSPDTRAVLVSGENPLAQSPSGGAMGGDPAMGGRGGGRGTGGGQGIGGGGGRGGAPLPQLRGLSLVVGLALGSPEFQRR